MKRVLDAIGWSLLVTSVTLGLAACATTGSVSCRYTPAEGWVCTGGAEGVAQLPPVATPAL